MTSSILEIRWLSFSEVLIGLGLRTYIHRIECACVHMSVCVCIVIRKKKFEYNYGKNVIRIVFNYFKRF